MLWLLGFLLIVPASELAVLAVNYFVTSILRPQVLAKMSFEEEGIPDDCRTLVVVPMMLTTPAAIENEVNRLEIRYLGNADTNLRFALLSDFADAPQQVMPEDAEYLDIAVRGIEQLNQRHGAGRFFLFHRGRSWSESEQRWIGWERKRGKLEQLNRFLVGESAPELEGFLCAGDRATTRGHPVRHHARRRYATAARDRSAVDRNTGPSAQPGAPFSRWPPSRCAATRSFNRGSARPCRARPRRGFRASSPTPRGIDPYTHAVSDVYQDLTGEGSYHGKGIYDLRTFHHILSGRFPDAHLLSHDLLEGSHVRVALATDIELLDVFPSSYIAWWNRQHRWIRGDWQIIDWLNPRVPRAAGGSEPNPLSTFSRWKIFDNLRRSLVPPATVALLLAGWLFTPAPKLWSVIIAGLMLWPVINSILGLFLHPPPPGTRFWRDPRDRSIRSVFAIIFLLDYAGMALNAIARVAYRRLRSHRLFLEWETAQAAHQRASNQQRQFVLRRLWIPAPLPSSSSSQRWFVSLGRLWPPQPFLTLVAFLPGRGHPDQSPGQDLRAAEFSRRATARCCARPRAAPGDISMSLSARKPTGCRRITFRKFRRAKSFCAPHRRTSAFGCWPRSRRMTLAISRWTIWRAVISARSKR